MLLSVATEIKAEIKAETITIFAAASTRDALENLSTQFMKETGREIIAVYAGSSTLAKQIEHGAPAQIFLSANESWANYLEERGFLEEETRQSLFHNVLSIVAPADTNLQPFEISSKTDLISMLNGERLAVGDPDHVPIGLYAKEALTHLNLWTNLAPHIAPTSDVQAALVLVERGETPLGIVYGSDAIASGRKIKQLAVFPTTTHRPMSYAIAIIKGQKNHATESFLEFLNDPISTKIFHRYGFITRP